MDNVAAFKKALKNIDFSNVTDKDAFISYLFLKLIEKELPNTGGKIEKIGLLYENMFNNESVKSICDKISFLDDFNLNFEKVIFSIYLAI